MCQLETASKPGCLCGLQQSIERSIVSQASARDFNFFETGENNFCEYSVRNRGRCAVNSRSTISIIGTETFW